MSPGQDDFSKTEILEAEPPRRRLPRPLIIAAITAAVVTAGAGVAAATTLSPSPGSPSPGSPAPTATATESPAPSDSPSARPDEGRRHMRGGWGMGPRMFGGGIHGEFVVPGEQEGQWITVATQLGEVTAVDQSSITVKSADGYTKQYVVNDDTRVNSSEGISAVKVGDRVAVSAMVSGDTATARAVYSMNLRPEPRRHGKRWGDRDDRFDRREGPREDRGKGSGEDSGASPTPSATSTA